MIYIRETTLRITDINNTYLRQGRLKVELLGRGFCWLDTGTHESLQQASNYVQTVQERQGLKIACLEEIAYRRGYLSADDLASLVTSLPDSAYREYLERVLADPHGTL